MSCRNGINGQLLCTALFFSLATENKYGECVSNEKQTALRVVLLRAQSFWVGGRPNKYGYEAIKIKLHRGTSNTANCTHILSYTVPQQLPLDTGDEEVSLIILMALDPNAPAAGSAQFKFTARKLFDSRHRGGWPRNGPSWGCVALRLPESRACHLIYILSALPPSTG